MFRHFAIMFAFLNLLLLFYGNFVACQSDKNLREIAERTQAMSLLLSSIQCTSLSDPHNQPLLKIKSTFHPKAYLEQYQNPEDVLNLLDFINRTSHLPKDLPFTNLPVPVSEMRHSLDVLFHNTENFHLFYNTSAWLIGDVNHLQLYWALSVTLGEKFPEIIVPSAIEVFPQLFINKVDVLKSSNKLEMETGSEEKSHRLAYFMSDPGLNEFHVKWHMQNPFWWDVRKYGVERWRRGELFLYMHHQLLSRYEAELMANDLEELSPLDLHQDYTIPESFSPDIVNVDFAEFPERSENASLGSFELENGEYLRKLAKWYERIDEGVHSNSFVRKDGSKESLQFANGSDILGLTVEPVSVHSINLDYYGIFHNSVHRLLAGIIKNVDGVPGVQGHPETSMRDPVFYRLHKTVDNLYLKLKAKKAPYTIEELDFSGIEIISVELISRSKSEFVTYFDTVTYDISTAARPCRGISEEGTPAQVQILNHYPFHYRIVVKSIKKNMAYGMARIFLLPEYTPVGNKIDIETSHSKAIELDRFRVELAGVTVIKRASWESSVTNSGQRPGLKSLYHISPKEARNILERKVGCGYPANLLIPKGTENGLRYKLTVMISEEEEQEEARNARSFPYCGVLHGKEFPDKREMGYPFDRRGTRLNGFGWGNGRIRGLMRVKNVKEIPVVIRHLDL